MSFLQMDGAACEPIPAMCGAATSALLFHSARFFNPCDEILAKSGVHCAFSKTIVTSNNAL